MAQAFRGRGVLGEKTAKSPAAEGRSRAAPPRRRPRAPLRAGRRRRCWTQMRARPRPRSTTTVPEDGRAAREEALELPQGRRALRLAEPGASSAQSPAQVHLSVLPSSYVQHPFLPDGEDHGAAHPRTVTPPTRAALQDGSPPPTAASPFSPAHTNPSPQTHGSTLRHCFSREILQPPRLLWSSHRVGIEVLPVDLGAGGYSGNSGSPKNGKFILPPGIVCQITKMVRSWLHGDQRCMDSRGQEMSTVAT